MTINDKMHILSSPGQGMPGFSGTHGNTVERERDCEKNTDKHFQNDLSVTSSHLSADMDFGVKKQSLSRPSRSAAIESGYWQTAGWGLFLKALVDRPLLLSMTN